MSRDQLAELALLSQQFKSSQAAIKDIEKLLSDEKERFRRISEEDIPALMAELQYSEIKLDSGEKITVKNDVYASIPAKYKREAFDWLTEHDFGGLIKSELSISFGREEIEAAVELKDKLADDGYTIGFNESVHAQTLKAWLREQLEAGVAVPLDIFGARQVNKATIK